MSAPFDRRQDAAVRNFLIRVDAEQRARRFDVEVEVRRPDGAFARFTQPGGSTWQHVIDAIDGSGARVSARPVAEGVAS